MIYNIFTTEPATLIKLISSIDFVLVLVLLGYHFHHTFFFLSSSSSSSSSAIIIIIIIICLCQSVLCLLLTALTAFDDAQKNAQSTAHKKNAHLH